VTPDPRPLTAREFRRFQQLIARVAGIHLTEAKVPLLESRLARHVRRLGLRTYGAYYERLEGPDGPAETQQLLDLVCTNETSFFREPRQFELLARAVFPAWAAAAAAGRRPRTVRAWSAACATGEEPYSLAMLLLEHFPPDGGWALDVLATDLSTRALARARAGVYAAERAAAIAPEHRRRYLLRGVGANAGTVKIAPEVQQLVRFAHANLHAPPYPAAAPLDLVLCRNVLIYFGPAARREVLARLLGLLAPWGLLLLGHAESLAGVAAAPWTCLQPNVYARAEARP
jgi:chemotaxis protein methyltransferase CheR